MRTMITLNHMEELASKFRADNGMSDNEPLNVKTIIRKLGALVMYRPLSGMLFGLSVKTRDGKKMFMLINSNSTRGRQHFTVAHEIYHLLYEENPQPHFCTEPAGKDTSEKNADLFASCLLMPKQGILENITRGEILTGDIAMSTLLKMEQLYGVSHQALTYRLKRLRIINETRLQELLRIDIVHTAFLYGIDSTLYMPGNKNLVIGDFGTKARELFEREKISEGHYMELLNLVNNEQD